MTTRYYWCAKCDDGIHSYAIDEENDETTFPRGEYLAHGDHIVTGFKSREDAQTFIDGPTGAFCREKVREEVERRGY